MNKINNALLALALIAMLCGTASAIYEWEQVNEEGFGDLANDYAWSMHEYDGYLYVGTLNTNVSESPNPMTDGLEIWRSPSGNTGSWGQVVGPAGTQFMAGFGSFCMGARGMEVHDNLLWVGTLNNVTGCQIWVTNGTHWKLANIPGFGDPGYTPTYNPNNIATRGITVFNGTIYAEAQNADDGAEVWRYTGLTDFNFINPAAWEQVVVAGFGEPDHNKGIGELVVFDPPDDGEDVEYLYAGTWAITIPSLVESGLEGKGCEVWRSSNGTIWEEVVGNESNYGMGRGFGDLDNNAVLSSKVFGDYLYMSTQNWIDAAEIWRTKDGTTWQSVTVNGFGHLNGYMWRMHVHDGKLLVGTFNPICGCEIWESSTGDRGDFEQVNRNGMDGNPLQYGARSFETFKDDLYIGTASFGTFVDRIISSISPIPTDLSSYVGCEVWRTNGTTYIPPDVYVNKTVWDPENQEWVHEMDATLDDTVRFRCEIHNYGSCDLTGIVVFDFISRSLKYAGGATRDPDEVIDYPIGTKLMWCLSDVTLQPGESVAIEYDANVVQCDRMDVNFLFVVGCCENTGYCGFGWDLVTIMASAGATEVKVDPASQTIAAGDAFYVNVTVENVVDMKADGAVLNFDPGIMQVTNITEGDFLKADGDTIGTPGWDNATGRAWFGYSLTGTCTPVNGSGTLATIEFEICPDAPPGTYDLSLSDVLLINASNKEISTDTSNGTVTIPTEVKVDPASQTIAAGDTFQVNVTVENVVDMKADGAVLNFDPGIMQVTNITEGDFLKAGGDTIGTPGWDNATGEAWFGYSLTGTCTPVNGSGTLATIEFEICPDAPPGTYDLSLSDVLLINASNKEISTDTSNGTVTIPTEVKVDPASQTIAAGDAFYVNVTVENVVGMKADQAVLNFDPGIMQVTNITEGDFLKAGGDTIGTPGWDNATGKAWFGYSLGTGTWTPVNGSGTLATIEFEIYPDAPPGTYDLNLTDILLINGSNEEISADTSNGTVTIPTEVKVDPASQTIAAGDAFYVNVTVENVVGMKADGAVLNFDPGAMQVTNITEGDFLKTGGNTIGTPGWDNATGEAWFGYSLTGTGTPVNGSGTLATIQFSTNDTECTYNLNLTGVILINASNVEIPTDAVNGTVTKVGTPPTVEIISPESRAYASTCVRLNFTAESGIDWIGYSLDGGANVTIAGNITIGTLGAGSHNIVVYVNDTVGKEGSDAVSFTLHPGDINDDDIVDIWDLVLLADAYLSKPGDTNWDPDANLNCDGTVDIWDLVILADNYLNEY